MDAHQFRYYQSTTDWKNLFTGKGFKDPGFALREAAIALEDHAIEQLGMDDNDALFHPPHTSKYHAELKRVSQSLSSDDSDALLVPHLMRLEEISCVRTIMDRFGDMGISEDVEQAARRPFIKEIHELAANLAEAQVLTGATDFDPQELARGVALEIEETFRQRLGMKPMSQMAIDAITQVSMPSIAERDNFFKVTTRIDWKDTIQESGRLNNVARAFSEFITEGRCQPRDHFEKVIAELPAAQELHGIRHDCGYTNNPIIHDHDIKNLLLIKTIIEKYGTDRIADSVITLADKQLKQNTRLLANEIETARVSLTGQRDRMASTTLANNFVQQMEDAFRCDLDLPPRQHCKTPS